MENFKNDLNKIVALLEKDRQLTKAQANCNIFAFVVLAVSITLSIAKIISFNELMILVALIIISYFGFEIYFKFKADNIAKIINKALKS